MQRGSACCLQVHTDVLRCTYAAILAFTHPANLLAQVLFATLLMLSMHEVYLLAGLASSLPTRTECCMQQCILVRRSMAKQPTS